MSGPSGDILTTFQAARLCGVSHKSIERWIDAGLLPGFRTPGGHRRVHRADLLGFVQSRRTVEGTGRHMSSTRGDVPRVLVVDDEGTIRSVFAEYYRSAHPDTYYIELAASGYEAGVQVERFKPHIMVLDLMMPDLDGFEVCKKVRSDPAHAAMIIIAMTGSDTAAARARESGHFHRVLLKPVKMAEVKDAIDELLAERGFVLDALVNT